MNDERKPGHKVQTIEEAAEALKLAIDQLREVNTALQHERIPNIANVLDPVAESLMHTGYAYEMLSRAIKNKSG